MSGAGNLFQENLRFYIQGAKSGKHLSYSYRRSILDKLGIWLLKNGLSIDAWTFLMFVLNCISALFIGCIFIKNGLFIFTLLSLIFIFLTFIVIDFRGRKIIHKKEGQLEGFLIDLLGNLYANPNILLGIQKTLETSEEPLKQEFEHVVDDVRRGVLLNEALKNMLNRNKSKIFDVIVTGLIAANEKGADVMDFLKDQIDYIREKKSISNYIKILSSGPKYTSYIIMLIPLAALTISALINRNFIGSLLSGTGLAVLVYSIISYTAGFLIINRIVSFTES